VLDLIFKILFFIKVSFSRYLPAFFIYFTL
jgi:hypothetical protein